MKILKDESGQAMILTLLCMTCLLGFVGFAVDVGVLLNARRQMQTAADSAAIAAASELNYGSGNMTTAANVAAAQNGVTIGVNGGAVTINSAPLSGAYAGKAGYVEAIVSRDQPTFFMKMFNFASMNVSARAVAGLGVINQNCVFVLSPSASPAMELQGSFTVKAQSCGVVVDSNGPDALDFSGGAGTLTAQSVGVVGGDGGHTGDSTPAPVTGMAPEGNPLGSMADPTPSSCTSAGTLTGTLGPATSADGTICYSGNVTLHNVTLNQGTYVFTGNVTLSGTVSTGTGGATIDLVNGSLTEATGTTLNLVAPTTGDYSGIAIMESSSNSSVLAFDKGSASGKIEGIIYAPSAELSLQDSGGDTSGGLSLITDLVVNTLYDKTATLSIASYSQAHPTTTPLRNPTLVE